MEDFQHFWLCPYWLHLNLTWPCPSSKSFSWFVYLDSSMAWFCYQQFYAWSGHLMKTWSDTILRENPRKMGIQVSVAPDIYWNWRLHKKFTIRIRAHLSIFQAEISLNRSFEFSTELTLLGRGGAGAESACTFFR